MASHRPFHGDWGSKVSVEGRLFWHAPTVKQFFAVPGGLTGAGSMPPSPSWSMPEFPAEKRISTSRCSNMNLSVALAFALYCCALAGSADPHELVWMRAPAV